MAYYRARRPTASGNRAGYRVPRGRTTVSRGAYRGRATRSATAATIVIQMPQGSLRPRARAGYARRSSWRARY